MKTKLEEKEVDKSKAKVSFASLRKNEFFAAALVIVLLFFAVASVSATEYQVHEGESIQAVINMANPGDTIIVHNGTYTENVVVNRSNITLRSANGSAVTIVQSNRTDMHVLNITDQKNVTLEGFTIRDASATPSMTKGLIAMSLSALLLPPEHQTGLLPPEHQTGLLPPQYQKGSISVTSVPSGASIGLDGQWWGMLYKTPYTLQELEPGSHTVELSLAGYKKWSQEVYVTAGKTKQVHATLTPETPSPTTGSIKIDSSPRGATVKLDGQTFLGTISATPAMIPGLDPGRHTVELSLEGYYNWGPKEVDVNAGETTPVHATMTPKPTPTPPPTTGSISVQSSPSGATIKLDDYIGPRTPHTFPTVSPGHHKLVLSLDGYYDWKTNVDVEAGRNTPVYKTLKPIPTTGTITVFSSPPGADIYLDNKYVGRKVYTITGVLPGPHTLKLCLVGYSDWSTSVPVTVGETTPVHATLTPIPSTGAILVKSEPPSANIRLDGVPINALTPYTIPNVVAGPHILELALKGYLDWSANVQVAPGKTAEVDARLIPRPIRAGIYMNNASNCVIIGNRIVNITTTVNYSAVGIAIYNSSGNGIQNGAIINCGQGIWITSGSANRIEGNKIQNNSIAGTGVRLESGVINTGIHENCFIDNVPQAWDDGTYNNWISNFWSQPPGGTGNYTIPGAAGSADTDHLDVCPL